MSLWEDNASKLQENLFTDTGMINGISQCCELILKLEPANCQAITGSQRLNGFCVQVHLPVYITNNVCFNINIYTGAPKYT